jgi:glycosyltransferase involved in cell wall biosynthesis
MDMTPFINPRWFKKTFSLYYQILFPLVAVSSKLIVTISDWSKNDISRILNIEKDKIVNVGCGVTALGSSDLALVKRKSYILAVSSIEPRKNFKFLVDAFNKMNRDVDLIIIGSEGKVFSNPGIKKAIKGSGNIFFTGYVSDEVLAGYYAGALLFIYPSLYEGFGLPPLEAMSAGCPVLVSNASSLPEVCGDAAEYFDPENEGELIQKARELIDNSLLRSELTNKGDEQVKKHNWSNSYKKLEEQLLRHV